VVDALYREYVDAYPNIYRDWVEVERKGNDIVPEDFRAIQAHLYDFLGTKFTWENHLAPVEVFADFRKIIVQEALGYALVPRKELP
jgi:hypothetical protein